MKLERIDIRRITYGDDEGRYKATVRIKGENGFVSVVMSPDLSDEMLRHCGDAVKKYSKKAADELIASITESIKSTSKEQK